MLRGQPGPVRDIVLLNAGAGLFVAGRAESVREGIAGSRAGHRQRASALAALEALVRVTTEPRPA